MNKLLSLRSLQGRVSIRAFATAKEINRAQLAKEALVFMKLSQADLQADSQALRKRYLELAKAYHPDAKIEAKQGSDDEAAVEKAEQEINELKVQFQKLQEAYSMLRKMSTRDLFDALEPEAPKEEEKPNAGAYQGHQETYDVYEERNTQSDRVRQEYREMRAKFDKKRYESWKKTRFGKGHFDPHAYTEFVRQQKEAQGENTGTPPPPEEQFPGTPLYETPIQDVEARRKAKRQFVAEMKARQRLNRKLFFRLLITGFALWKMFCVVYKDAMMDVWAPIAQHKTRAGVQMQKRIESPVQFEGELKRMS